MVVHIARVARKLMQNRLFKVSECQQVLYTAIINAAELLFYAK